MAKFENCPNCGKKIKVGIFGNNLSGLYMTDIINAVSSVKKEGYCDYCSGTLYNQAYESVQKKIDYVE